MQVETNEVSVTYEQILMFRETAAKYQARHFKDRNEFLHALSRVLKFTKEAADDYNELLNEIQVKNAKKDDKTKSFILDSKENYTFDETGKVSYYQDHRALLNTVVHVKQYTSAFIPKDIGHLEWNVFYPFVLTDEFPPFEAELTS